MFPSVPCKGTRVKLSYIMMELKIVDEVAHSESFWQYFPPWSALKLLVGHTCIFSGSFELVYPENGTSLCLSSPINDGSKTGTLRTSNFPEFPSVSWWMSESHGVKMPLPVMPYSAARTLAASSMTPVACEKERWNCTAASRGSWFIHAVGYTICRMPISFTSVTAGSRKRMSKQVNTPNRPAKGVVNVTYSHSGGASNAASKYKFCLWYRATMTPWSLNTTLVLNWYWPSAGQWGSAVRLQLWRDGMLATKKRRFLWAIQLRLWRTWERNNIFYYI